MDRNTIIRIEADIYVNRRELSNTDSFPEMDERWYSVDVLLLIENTVCLGYYDFDKIGWFTDKHKRSDEYFE